MSKKAPFLAALATVVIAFGAAAWSGYSWWDGAHDSGIQRGVARQDALQAGRQEITAFTTLDYRQAGAGYGQWLDASTGALHDELAQDQTAGTQRITEAKAVSVGKILDAAVTELDDGAGTARVIAAVEVSVTPSGAAAVVKHNRFQADLTRTASGWKLNALAPVPVGGTS